MPRQILARRRLDAGRLRQLGQKLLVARARVPPHDRSHRRVRLQRRRVDANVLPLSRPLGQHPQHPGEDLLVGLQVDQPRVREIVEWSGVACSRRSPRNSRKPSESAARQAMPRSRVDALEVAHQQQPEVVPPGARPGAAPYRPVESLAQRSSLLSNPCSSSTAFSVGRRDAPAAHRHRRRDHIVLLRRLFRLPIAMKSTLHESRSAVDPESGIQALGRPPFTTGC